MKNHIFAATASALLYISLTAGGYAAPTGEPAQGTQIMIEFGSKANDPVVSPKKMVLDRNKVYTLVVNNPSKMTHFIVPAQLSRSVRTIGLNIDGGKAITVSGYNPRRSPHHRITRINEIEIRSGGKVAWTFVPVVAGNYTLECGIPSHTAAGMKATVIIN